MDDMDIIHIIHIYEGGDIVNIHYRVVLLILKIKMLLILLEHFIITAAIQAKSTQ